MTVVLGQSYDANNNYIGYGSVGWTQITPSKDSAWDAAFLYPAAWLYHEGTSYDVGSTGPGGYPPATGDGSRLVYFSSSGLDANPGTQNSPKLTFSLYGLSIPSTRWSKPDWVLLKKGDIFTDQSFYSDPDNGMTNGWPTPGGKSIQEPMVFTSYGSGAQPIVRPKLNQGAAIGGQLAGQPDYVFIKDIHFDGRNIDTLVGILWNQRAVMQSIRIEGCKVENFGGVNGGNGIQVTPGSNILTTPYGGLYDFVVRRNVISHNDNQGMLGPNIFSGGLYIFEENNFDSTTPHGSVNNHNWYIGGYIPDNCDYNGVTCNRTGAPNSGIPQYCNSAKGNISTRDASGTHFRSGGQIIDNLFVKDQWPFDCGSLDYYGFPATQALYNVVLDPDSSVNSAIGIQPSKDHGCNAIYNGDDYNGHILFQYNIIGHTITGSPGKAFSIGPGSGGSAGAPQSVFDKITFTNNIMISWCASPQVEDLSGAGTNVLYPNYSYVGGAWEANGATFYSNGAPTFGTIISISRTVETYDSEILRGPGTFDHWIALVLAQTPDNWNYAYTANALNSYVRAGVGLTMGSGTASTKRKKHIVVHQ